MAKAQIRLVNKVHPDPAVQIRLTQRGDIIAIKDDNDPPFTATESSFPWAILDIPGVPASLLTSYIAEEPDDGTDKLRHRRQFGFNVDLWLSQGKPPITSIAQALTYKVTKPAVKGLGLL